MYTNTEAYKTFDGLLFEDEDKANEHAENILGEELEGLLKLAKIEISRNQEYRALIEWIKNKKELKKSINILYAILNYGDNNE